jgi:hypothetical protein
MFRRLAAAVAVVGLLGASATQAHDVERQAELLDELLRLNSENVAERIIIKQIRAWCFRFELDGDDIVELHTLGVSDDIIETLIDTAFEELDCEGDDYEYIWYRGAYSPWWYVPYAWGWYWWDPWPSFYVHHSYYYPYWYYPCHYGYGYGHHDGYYGWHGGDYYVAYNPRRRVPPPESRERARGDYGLVTHSPAVAVGSGVVARQPRGGSGAVVVPGQREIDSRRSPTLTPHSGAAAAAATPTAPAATQPRRSPADNRETPITPRSRAAAQLRTGRQLEPVAPGRRAEPRNATPAVEPRTNPTSPAKRVETPKRSPRRVAPSQPAKRVDLKSKFKRPRRVTPSQPAKRLERGTKSAPSKRVTPSKRSRSDSKPAARVSPSKRSSKRSSVKTPSSSKRSQVRPPTRSKHSLSRSRPSHSRSSRSVSRPSGSGTRASAPRARSSSRSRGRSR